MPEQLDATAPPFDLTAWNAEMETLNASAEADRKAHAEIMGQTERPSSLLDVATQAPIGALAGLVESVAGIVNPVIGLLGGETLPYMRWNPEDPQASFVAGPISSQGLPRPVTISGGLARGLTQATTGIVATALGPGKFIKGGQLLRGALIGAGGDYLAFGATEERLSNVLAPLGIPVVSRVADYLKADGDDGEIAGRLKNVAEGGILGLALAPLFEGIGRGLKMVKAARTAPPAVARQMAAEGTAEVERAVQEAGIAPQTTPEAAARVAKAEVTDWVLRADPRMKPEMAEPVAVVVEALAKYVDPSRPAHEVLDSIVEVRSPEPVPSALRQDAEPTTLYQRETTKGSTEFLEDGKAVVRYFESADASTHLHEMAHVVSKHLKPEDREVIDGWLGKSDWDTAAHEQFARGFERYIREGDAPTPALKQVFEKLSDILKGIYKSITGSSIDVAVSPEVKAVYDKLLGVTETEAAEKAAVGSTIEKIRSHGLDLSQEETRALASRISGGGDISKIPHLTDKLLAAGAARNLVPVMREMATLANKLNPTGTHKLGAVKRLADELGRDQGEVVDWFRTFADNTKDLDAQVAAFDVLVHSTNKKVDELAKAAADAKASDAELADFLRWASQLEDLTEIQFQGQTNLARGLGAMRLRGTDLIQPHIMERAKRAKRNPESVLTAEPAGGVKSTSEAALTPGMKRAAEDANELAAFISAAGGAKQVRKLAQFIVSNPNSKTVQRVGEISKLTTVMGKIQEYWINQILSGPKTHMANIVGNAINTVMLPAARALGGIATKDAAQARMGLAQLQGLRLALHDAWAAAKTKWNTGTDVLDPVLSHEVAEQLAQKQIKNPHARTYLLWAGRALQAEDTFFKHLSFRATAYADLLERSLDQPAATRMAWVDHQMKLLWDDPTSYANGVQMAKLGTFQEDLPPALEWLRDARDSFPLAWLVLPFVKTPPNIIRQLGHHIPGLPLLFRDTRDILYGRGSAAMKSILIGRQLIGFGFVGTVAALWSAGAITGSGPLDKQERDAWMAAGNRPYAVKVGDTWVDLKRLNPYSNLLGLTVDSLEAGRELKDPGKAVDIILAGLRRNISDQTFFEGVQQLTAALEHPKFLAGYAENLAGSFLPQSSATRQITQSITGTVVRMDSLLDQVRARSMGLLAGHPKRDIDGNPVDVGHDEGLFVMPISTALHDPLLNELAKVPGGIGLEPPSEVRGVQLTANQRDQLWEAQGKVQLSGKTLRQALGEVIGSRSYQAAPPLEDVPTGYETSNPRRLLLFQVVERYRRAAWDQVSRKDPMLSAAVVQERDNRRATRSGDFELVKELINE